VGNSLDALCKRFKINIEAREKHSALLDCHLLSKVYIELIDKKELTLDLNSNDQNFDNKQRLVGIKGNGIVNKISEEQMEEYKKFLKKNISNSFALN
jgi:DNA polymerase-3 subunit epsilon